MGGGGEGGAKKPKPTKQTMQSIYERKASALLWLKWIETESVHNLKERRSSISEHRREKKKCCFYHFSANHWIQGCRLFSISISMQHLSIFQ